MPEKILKTVRLGPQHQQPGHTYHNNNGEGLGPFVKLAIVSYGDGSYYLFYYDSDDGEEITDTFHESVEAAMEQAKFEFGVTSGEWQDI